LALHTYKPSKMKVAGLCLLAACGANAFVAPAGRLAVAQRSSTSMMAAIGSKEEWVKVLKTSEIAPGELVPVDTDGLQLLIAADLGGSIYAMANICPHLGTPLDQGSINAAGAIVCPLHKSAFSLETGELVGDWCPFPPILGPLVLGKLEPPKNVAIFPVRAKGQSIEVLINKNMKAQFESKYWSGILDAKGKATGDYY
jgi:nitrite reductase/ring-hydroxylating ferredoxin subunit